MEKIVVSGKNHRPAPCHCQTLSQNVVPSTPHYKRYLNTHGIALVTLRIFDSIHVRHTNKPEAFMMLLDNKYIFYGQQIPVIKEDAATLPNPKGVYLIFNKIHILWTVNIISIV